MQDRKLVLIAVVQQRNEAISSSKTLQRMFRGGGRRGRGGPYPNVAFFIQWLQNNAAAVIAQPPNSIIDVPQSSAIRFRWFNVLTFQGNQYGLGANIHYNGSLGGVWLFGGGVQGIEVHPNNPPQNPVVNAFTLRLQELAEEQNNTSYAAAHLPTSY